MESEICKKDIEYWKKEAKLSMDAYKKISEDCRKVERENKKLKKDLENNKKVIEKILNLCWELK